MRHADVIASSWIAFIDILQCVPAGKTYQTFGVYNLFTGRSAVYLPQLGTLMSLCKSITVVSDAL